MLLLTLLSHQFKSFWRSRNAGKSLAIQIFIGFIVLYLLSVSIAAGLYLGQGLEKFFPGQDVVRLFCGLLLYYFCFDILLRYMMQDLPTLAIQPYLVQNIRRRQLIRFLNLRSLFTVINLLPLILFLPFTIRYIGPLYGYGTVVGFAVALVLLTIFNHFLVLYIKRKTILSSWWLVGFFALIAGLGLCDYFKVFSLRSMSAALFFPLLTRPWLAVVPFVLAVAAWWNNYLFLYRNLYLEDIEKKNKRREGSDYTFLDRFGAIGELIAVDLKLIFRNKRPRSLFMMSLIFVLYGFILYKPNYLNSGHFGILMLGALFVTGIFVSNYGQFLFAWQSGHFDGLMSGRLSVRTYTKSKFLLLISVSTAQLLLSTIYLVISWKLVLMQIAAYFYIVGIQTVLTVYFATRSYKYIDITQKATFNYQGLGGTQWVLALLLFLIPFGIYLPFSFLVGPWAGVAALGLAGLISLLLQDWWIGVLTKEFNKRKYLILEGFREK